MTPAARSDVSSALNYIKTKTTSVTFTTAAPFFTPPTTELDAAGRPPTRPSGFGAGAPAAGVTPTMVTGAGAFALIYLLRESRGLPV
jgi:hypothetical protein